MGPKTILLKAQMGMLSLQSLRMFGMSEFTRGKVV